MRFRFRFRWVPFIAMLAALSLGVVLGEWQRGRAVQKETIQSRLEQRQSAPALQLRGDAAIPDAGELEYRRVTVAGQFISEWPLFLENRPYKGVAGFFVLMPMRLEGSDKAVLVLRGWTPRDPVDRARVPAVPVPQALVTVTGRVRRDTGRVMQLGEAAPVRPAAILQNVEIAEFARASRLQLLPFIIEQSNNSDDGLVRDWPDPSSGSGKHMGYAFQWYALAATALIFFLVTGFRRGTSKA